MLLIKLLATQVTQPELWDAVKSAVKKAGEAGEIPLEHYPAYFNALLNGLLSDNVQCYLRMSDDKRLLGLFITEMKFNKITNEKFFHFLALRSWEKTTEADWIKIREMFEKIAKNEGCVYISFETKNPNMMDIAKKYLGFRESSRNFRNDLGNNHESL